MPRSRMFAVGAAAFLLRVSSCFDSFIVEVRRDGRKDLRLQAEDRDNYGNRDSFQMLGDQSSDESSV